MSKYIIWNQKDADKMKLIKIARNNHQNDVVRRIATQNKDRFHYKTMQQTSDTTNGTNHSINNIIKPSTAIYHSDIKHSETTNDDHAQNTMDIANTFNIYFNSIGTSTSKINPKRLKF